MWLIVFWIDKFYLIFFNRVHKLDIINPRGYFFLLINPDRVLQINLFLEG